MSSDRNLCRKSDAFAALNIEQPTNQPTWIYFPLFLPFIYQMTVCLPLSRSLPLTSSSLYVTLPSHCRWITKCSNNSSNGNLVNCSQVSFSLSLNPPSTTPINKLSRIGNRFLYLPTRWREIRRPVKVMHIVRGCWWKAR